MVYFSPQQSDLPVLPHAAPRSGPGAETAPAIAAWPLDRGSRTGGSSSSASVRMARAGQQVSRRSGRPDAPRVLRTSPGELVVDQPETAQSDQSFGQTGCRGPGSGFDGWGGVSFFGGSAWAPGRGTYRKLLAPGKWSG